MHDRLYAGSWAGLGVVQLGWGSQDGNSAALRDLLKRTKQTQTQYKKSRSWMVAAAGLSGSEGCFAEKTPALGGALRWDAVGLPQRPGRFKSQDATEGGPRKEGRNATGRVPCPS